MANQRLSWMSIKYILTYLVVSVMVHQTLYESYYKIWKCVHISFKTTISKDPFKVSENSLVVSKGPTFLCFICSSIPNAKFVGKFYFSKLNNIIMGNCEFSEHATAKYKNRPAMQYSQQQYNMRNAGICR